MSINPSTMRLGIVAIVVGLAGAYGVQMMMDEEVVPEAPVAPKVTPIPLANNDLPMDRAVRMGDIAIVPMTQKQMEERNLPISLVMTNSSQIIGRIPKKPIRQGEPFLTTGMYLDSEGPDINDLLKPGYRAVNLQVPNTRGGTTKAGDIVDVIFRSHRVEPKNEGDVAIPEKTITLIQAVDVLRVTRPQLNRLQAVVGYRAKEPTVTLAVKPIDAHKLQTVEPHGELALAIRSNGDSLAKATDATESNLWDILGIEPEPEPEPEPPQAPPPSPYVVEKFMRGSRQLDHFPKANTPPQLTERYREQVKMERMIAKIRELQAQGLLPSDEEIQQQRELAAAGKQDQVASGTGAAANILPEARPQQPLPRRATSSTRTTPGPMNYPMTKNSDMGMGTSSKDMETNPFQDDPMTLEVMP